MSDLDITHQKQPGRNYKWVALSNTTLGAFIGFVNGSSIMIALPAIFRGIELNPMTPGNFAYLLWIIMGYMLVQAVLVVSLGRVGDMFGRVRMYNLGFVIFTVASILLSITWSTGPAGAIELIVFRIVQAVGGSFLLANSAAILTDAFPANERGLALGINMVAAVAGSFIGLIMGGVLAEIGWRWVFIANIPFGLVGTIWAYLALKEVGIHKASKVDWIGNITFAAGLTLLLIGIVGGIAPSDTSGTSWTSPGVLGLMIAGIFLHAVFVIAELRVKDPMFRLPLFRIRSFIAGNIAGLLSSIGRGGLQIMLVIWLQGIWLPLHGYSFAETPLWAGIYMLPIAAGFLLAGPISGRLSDTYGPRFLATGGMVLAAISFALLMLLPADFPYPAFALLIFINGVASGLFISPNTAAIMNSVPAESRGVASGMRAAFVNVGTPLSIALYFSLMVIGLNVTVPPALYNGLTQNGISSQVADHLAKMPAIGYLFAALLGYNPLSSLLGQDVLNSLPAAAAEKITSRTFFPEIISGPFQEAFAIVMIFSIVICLIAAAASWMRGEKYIHDEVKKAHYSR
ncbi:MAG: MFS transporter [Dehalococcoidia bacterium]